jgi:uncharacterized protein YdhG (YjbR/CyaY superfamily)
MKNVVFKDIDEYIVNFPPNVQTILQQIRQAIHEAAPDAVETISYKMPAFKQNGILLYFAAFKNHIGFFPTSSGVEAFKEQLSAFKTSKGTIQFQLDKPIPLLLIKEIVRFRVEENLSK